MRQRMRRASRVGQCIAIKILLERRNVYYFIIDLRRSADDIFIGNPALSAIVYFHWYIDGEQLIEPSAIAPILFFENMMT